MAFVQHLLRWGSARRLTACLLLAVSAWMLFPVTFQASPAGSDKDQSTPFPCQDRPCGCRTAEQCWKKCCCFTNAQKLAWAKSRGVKPPEFVVSAARTESKNKASAKCCCHSQAKSCDSARPSEKPQPSGFVVSLGAVQCHGVDTTILGLPICVIPELIESPQLDRPAYQSKSIPNISPLIPAERQPPTPPPKIVLA